MTATPRSRGMRSKVRHEPSASGVTARSDVPSRRRGSMPGFYQLDEKTIWPRAGERPILWAMKSPAHGILTMVYLAMYLFGFCLACPMLVLVAIAYAQQADFA